MRTDNADKTLVMRGLLRINEAAEYAAIGRTVAYRLIGRGDWPTVVIGRSRRVPVKDLDAWIRANTRTAPGGRQSEMNANDLRAGAEGLVATARAVEP